MQAPLVGHLHDDVAADGLPDAELVTMARRLVDAGGGAVQEAVLLAVLGDLDATPVAAPTKGR